MPPPLAIGSAEGGVVMRANVAAPGRYGRLYVACLRNCLARELEFRGSFILKLVSATSWSLNAMLLAGLVFSNVRSIGDWDLDRMFVLTGAFLFVDYLVSAVVLANMNKLSELVNKGDLDFVLTKPISSQFLVSARYIDFTDLPGSFVGIAYIVIGLHRLGIQPSLVDIVLCVGLLMCALLSIYAVWFMSVTLSLWTGRISNIGFLYLPITELGRVPTDVYRGPLRPLLTLVLPVALAGTLPAKALIGMLDPWSIAYYAPLTLGLLWLSNRFWRFSLRQYSSASS